MGERGEPSGRRRPSNPIQGDDIFRSRGQARHNAPFFRLGADDGDDFWSNLDERRAQHRQHLIWLAVAFAVISILALIVHSALMVFALILLIPMTVEAIMLRRTRSRVKIPDYRPAEPVDVDLEHEDH